MDAFTERFLSIRAPRENRPSQTSSETPHVDWGPLISIVGGGGFAALASAAINPGSQKASGLAATMNNPSQEKKLSRMPLYVLGGAGAAVLLTKLVQYLASYNLGPAMPLGAYLLALASKSDTGTPAQSDLARAADRLVDLFDLDSLPLKPQPTVPLWTPPSDARWLDLTPHPSVGVIIGKRSAGSPP